MSHARWLVALALLVAVGLGAALLLRGEGGDGPADETARGTEEDAHADATLQGRAAAGDPARAGAAAIATEALAPEDLAAGDVLLRGRVVGPDGRPASGATIEVAHEETVIARGDADVEGSFAIRLLADRITGTWQGRLFAADAAGHGAVQLVHWGPHPSMPPRMQAAADPVVEVGVVRLLVTHALDVEVRFPPGATAPATVQAGATGHGALYALGAQRTDDQGRLRLESLPEGTVRVLAIAQGSGRWSGFVTFPREEAGPLVIDLPVERLVTVEVVDATTQAPIAGAVLTATEWIQAPGTSFVSTADWWPPLDPARTDATGRLVLRGLPPEGRVRLSANAEGYPAVPSNSNGAQFGTARLEADTTDVRIELPPPRTVRWPIEDGPVPRPAEGADVTIRPAPGTYLADVQIPTEGRIEAGELVVGGWPPGPLHGHAVAPGGGIARLFARADTDTGNPITFFPARKVEARLRYPDGEPAAGFFVNLRNQGNNPVASSDPTDAQGRAVIEDLYGGPYSLLQVHASEDRRPWGGVLLGTVNLEEGDGHVEGTVERIREAVLCFTLDGERRLPAEPRITLGSFWPEAPERDEAAAEIRFAWRPTPGQPEAHLGVEVEGRLPFSTKVAVPPVGTPLVVDVVLEPSGAFLVRVTLPEDGRVRVVAQRWDAEKDDWSQLWLPMTRMGGYAKPDANGRIRFEPLAAGRYRALDTIAGIATSPVEVAPGGPEAEVVLDAGRSGWARGKVVLPEGVAASGALVHVDGVERFSNMGSGVPGAQGLVARVREDGTFWIRVPGDREVVLRPAAPTLRPHTTRGTVRLTAPREDLVLELVRDHVATLWLGEALSTDWRPGQTLTRTVLLFAGEARGEPAHRATAIVEDEGRSLVFGGFTPGTYTIWIDADPFAPLVLPDRTLGEGTTDLGEVAVSEGARVVLELLLPEGQAAPRAYAWASHEGEPAYRRSVNWQGPKAVLKGLGPGRHEIRVGSHMGAGLGHVETIELAAGEEQHITIDLR